MNMSRIPYSRSPLDPIRSASGSLFSIASITFSLAVAASATLLGSCIERSNPFDPINSGPQAAVDVRKLDKPSLDSIAVGESVFAAFLTSVLAKFTDESASNADRIRDNALWRGENASVQSLNSGVEAFNRTQAVKDSLRLKTGFVSLSGLKVYGPYTGFADHRAGLHALGDSVTTHFTLVNAGNAPLIVYGAAFIDSVLVPFRRDSIGYARAQARFDSANAAVADSNLAVAAYNAQREAENGLVRDYNDSIRTVKRLQNANVIARSDSLQAGTFVAKAGDSLFLGPGTFNVDLRFTNTGTADSPIVVRGYPGRATIIRPSLAGSGSMNSLVLGSGRKYIRFENLVFRGGVEGNVKLEGGASKIVFRNCLFDSSAGAGFESFDSDFEMTDCEIRANRDVGVRLGGGSSPGGRLRFTNVLIARNGKAGLHSTSQLLELRKCTLAENGADGIQIISPLQEVTIANTLIARNHGFGIEREATNINQDLLSVSECDLFGNDAGNWFLPEMETARTAKLFSANQVADPKFVDAPAFDYSPEPGSFLDILEKQALPVVIGYRKPAP
jgi:hypothetical protein